MINNLQFYKNIIIKNRNYILQIITSLLFYSIIIIFFYYIIFTLVTINEKHYEIRYQLIKFQTPMTKIYKDFHPKLLFDEKKDEVYLFDKKGNIVYTFNNKNFNKGMKFFGFYFTFFNYNFLVGFKVKHYYFYKDFFEDIYIFLKVFSFIIYLLITGSLLILLEILKNENRKTLLKLANTEALATNNSMIILTENIHHELNTPLDVLENKYNKMKKEIIEYIRESCKYIEEKPINDYKDILKHPSCKKRPELIEFVKSIIKEDDFIKISIDQIRGILENMRDFKKLRFSNGNKTIYDLVEGSVKILKATYNSNFEYEIDDELKNYKINHNTKMKNSDLINILINHIKNSLEANAMQVKVYKREYKDGFLYLVIEDDGNGINKKDIPFIYSANYSTKNENDTIGLRGNGMFLNKYLLEVFGGTEMLLWTKKYEGTAFLLKIPVIKKED